MQHDHAYPQGGGAAAPLSFEGKLIKLLEHWIRHNEGHVGSCVEWARKAEASNLTDIARLLCEAADQTRGVSAKFEEALELLRNADAGPCP
jgi:hypothetical protein